MMKTLKKLLPLFLALALVATVFAACGEKDAANTSETSEAAESSGNAESEEAAVAGMSQVANPMVPYEDNSSFASIGVTRTLEAPAEASDVEYYIINDAMAQVNFTLDGVKYTLRGKQGELDRLSITGYYTDDSDATQSYQDETTGANVMVFPESINAWMTEDGVTYSLTAETTDTEAFTAVLGSCLA